MKPHPLLDTHAVCCGVDVAPRIFASGALIIVEWACGCCGERWHQQVGEVCPRRARLTTRGGAGE